MAGLAIPLGALSWALSWALWWALATLLGALGAWDRTRRVPGLCVPGLCL